MMRVCFGEMCTTHHGVYLENERHSDCVLRLNRSLALIAIGSGWYGWNAQLLVRLCRVWLSEAASHLWSIVHQLNAMRSGLHFRVLVT